MWAHGAAVPVAACLGRIHARANESQSDLRVLGDAHRPVCRTHTRQITCHPPSMPRRRSAEVAGCQGLRGDTDLARCCAGLLRSARRSWAGCSARQTPCLRVSGASRRRPEACTKGDSVAGRVWCRGEEGWRGHGLWPTCSGPTSAKKPILFTVVTIASRTSPLKGRKTTAEYLMGNVTRPWPGTCHTRQAESRAMVNPSHDAGCAAHPRGSVLCQPRAHPSR